jgi:hypothetical protein
VIQAPDQPEHGYHEQHRPEHREKVGHVTIMRGASMNTS